MSSQLSGSFHNACILRPLLPKQGSATVSAEMMRFNKSMVAAFLVSSTIGAGVSLTVHEAKAKNFRGAASLCTPSHGGEFNSENELFGAGGDFEAGDATAVVMRCPLIEFSDWNRLVVTEVEVSFYDNYNGSGSGVSACRSDFKSNTAECGTSASTGAGSNTPGWVSLFPAVTGLEGTWDNETLGTAYLNVTVGRFNRFDGYILKD